MAVASSSTYLYPSRRTPAWSSTRNEKAQALGYAVKARHPRPTVSPPFAECHIISAAWSTRGAVRTEAAARVSVKLFPVRRDEGAGSPHGPAFESANAWKLSPDLLTKFNAFRLPRRADPGWTEGRNRVAKSPHKGVKCMADSFGETTRDRWNFDTVQEFWEDQGSGRLPASVRRGSFWASC